MRQRKRLGFEAPTLPITADEVAEMFRAATAEPPFPDHAVCAEIADALSKNVGFYTFEASRDPQILRVEEAAKLLLRTLKAEDGPRAIELNQLEAALEESMYYFTPSRPPPAHRGIAPWAVASITAWLGAAGALANLGRHAGTTRNSIAIRFSVLALRRMGFPGATEAAVEKWITKIGVADDFAKRLAEQSVDRPS